MKYMLLIVNDPAAMGALGERMPEFIGAFLQYTKEMHEAGAFVAGEGLQAPDTAVTLSPQGDKVVETDGPFIETKEVVGGFYVVECEDRAAAVEWAKKIPVIPYGVGRVEVRPCEVYPES